MKTLTLAERISRIREIGEELKANTDLIVHAFIMLPKLIKKLSDAEELIRTVHDVRECNDELNHALGVMCRSICELLGETNNPKSKLHKK